MVGGLLLGSLMFYVSTQTLQYAAGLLWALGLLLFGLGLIGAFVTYINYRQRRSGGSGR